MLGKGQPLQECPDVGMVLLINSLLTKARLESSPLAQYAAKHWIHHAAFEGIDSAPLKLILQLFTPESAAFSTLFIFIICENAIFLLAPAFLQVNMQSVSKMDLAAHPYWGMGTIESLGKNTKLAECLQCTCHYMLTDFFFSSGRYLEGGLLQGPENKWDKHT